MPGERVESFNQQRDLAYVSDDWEKLVPNLRTHEYGNGIVTQGRLTTVLCLLTLDLIWDELIFSI